jgi:hypothetical protein
MEITENETAPTSDVAIACAVDVISTIETLSDGLAQRKAAPTRYYIAAGRRAASL